MIGAPDARFGQLLPAGIPTANALRVRLLTRSYRSGHVA
jgi:hypothetical protein